MFKAAAGIGKETAFSFAQAGASAIAFADINEKGAQEAAQTSKKFATHPEYKVIALKVDVVDPVSVQSMVDTTIKELGRIDYNVNSAGVDTCSFPAMSSERRTEQRLTYGRTLDRKPLQCASVGALA